MNSSNTQSIYAERTVIAQKRIRPRRALFVSDVICAGVAIVATQLFVEWRGPGTEAMRFTFLAANVVFLFITFMFMLRDGQYSPGRRISRLSDIGGLIKGIIVSAAFTLLVGYLTKGFFTGLSSPSRLVAVGGMLVFVALAVAARLMLAAYQNHMFTNGAALRRILVLGTGAASNDFLQFIETRPWLGVASVGRLSYSELSVPATVEAGAGETVHITSSLEGLEALDRALRTRSAQEVVVALDEADRAFLPDVTKLLTVAHVPYRIIPTLFECTFRNAKLDEFGELPVIDVEVDAMARAQRMLKRCFDVVVSVIALILTLPVTLCIMLAIVGEDGFPILFRQERVGKNGRRFPMLKFRTMVKDAEARLAELQAKNEAGSEMLFKIKKDPRITKSGKWLRRFSLDELPQFINVLRGEMSFVGPRPPLPREVEKYEEQHFCRLKALPGITGLWQVSGRSNLTFDEMVKLDRYYFENWSMGLDLKIVLKTFAVVLGRRGAY